MHTHKHTNNNRTITNTNSIVSMQMSSRLRLSALWQLSVGEDGKDKKNAAGKTFLFLLPND